MGYQDIMRMHPVRGNMAGRRGWGLRGQRSRGRRGRNDFAFNGGGRHDYGGHGAGGNSCQLSQDSSTVRLVTRSETYFKNTTIEPSETSDQSDEGTWPDEQKDNDKDKYKDKDNDND